MYSDETQKKMRSWADRSLMLMRKLLPLMSPVGSYAGWDKNERQTLGYLLSACARSTESALLLIAYGQLWDAEMLLRSVAEGTFKFCYLLQNHTHFKQRHEEYAHDLWRVALLKDHRKAEEFLAVLPNANDPEWDPIRGRLLAAVERAEIGRTYDQARRRSLESRWGFAGLMGELVRSGDPLFSRFAGFAHSYSLASHIQHADYVGTSLPLDRDRRPDKRRNSIQLSHAARLTSDSFSFLNLRLAVAYRFVGADFRVVAQAWQEAKELESEFRSAYQDWMAIEYPQDAT